MLGAGRVIQREGGEVFARSDEEANAIRAALKRTLDAQGKPRRVVTYWDHERREYRQAEVIWDGT